MVYRLCHHHPEAFWALNDNTCVHRVRLAAAAKDVGDVLDSNRHGPAHTRNDAIRADRALLAAVQEVSWRASEGAWVGWHGRKVTDG